MNKPDPTKSEGIDAEDNLKQEPMPSSEENTVVPAEDVSNEKEPQASSEESLPQEASERTRKNFERLQSQLAEAKAKLKEYETKDYGTSVFDQLRPPQQPAYVPGQVKTEFLPQKAVEDIKQKFIDEDGTVDINGLNQALTEANRRAQDAEVRAIQVEEKIARLEENEQVREAHALFPELDPLNKGSFDPNFYELVRDRMVRNMWEGKNQSFAQAAKDIKSQYFPKTDAKAVEKKAVEDFKKAQEARDQEPFETGKGASRQSDDDYDDLRKRTRQGDSEAIAERLRRAGY